MEKSREQKSREVNYGFIHTYIYIYIDRAEFEMKTSGRKGGSGGGGGVKLCRFGRF